MKRDQLVTSKIMSRIRSENTKPEILLRKSLWKLGLRYRKYYKITGKPDIVFVKIKLAIFCDGDFWHGNNWKIRGLANPEEELAEYSPYWRQKILRNIDRDQKVNRKLEEDGWEILRFWTSDIEKNSDKIAAIILEKVRIKENVSFR